MARALRVRLARSCRQAAHRARLRLQQTHQELDWLRRRLAVGVEDLLALTAELDQAHTELAAGDPGHGPSTGWEPALAELARPNRCLHCRHRHLTDSAPPASLARPPPTGRRVGACT